MKRNKLTIRINKPISEVFQFCVTPPNTKFWVPGVIDEKATDEPIKIGTVDSIFYNSGEVFPATIKALKDNQMIEYVSPDGVYHCQYTFQKITSSKTEFTYLEWVDHGDIKGPFNQKMLEQLKMVIEK